MFSNFYRVIKFALQNFFRNFWLSAVTIFIITLSFVTVNFFILANGFSDAVLTTIEQKANITIFFQVTAQESDVQAFKAEIENMPQIALLEYISKQDALERFKNSARVEGRTSIVDALDELEINPLQSSIIITARSIEDYPAILSAIEKSPYTSIIEEKTYRDRQSIITSIERLKGKIRDVGVSVMAFFAIIVALIIYNTIRITIYSRRKEFGIMKLVGASNWMIRMPLLLEGILYAVISLGITILILFPLLSFLQPYTTRYFDGLAFDVLGFFSDRFIVIFGYELAAAIGVNILASGLAIGRYLRV
ncbi:FtsX-like permease family protein [Candidatus Uhrbacteria bacterium]|nr:FtsX-like permease family protein [Candidatus Uhrbacteria bacterium]